MPRVSYEGDQKEAYGWLGKTLQELFRLRGRLKTLSLPQGSFRIQLSPTAYSYGYIIPGMEAVHIVAPGVPGETNPGIFYFEFATSGYPVVANGGAYRGCVVGVDLGLRDGRITTSAAIRTGERQDDLSDASLIGRTFDSRLADRRMDVADQWNLYGQSANPYTGIYAASVNYERPGFSNTETGAQEAFTKRIQGQAFEYNVDNSSPVVTATPEGLDRPRASGIQSVDGQLFVVYIDVFNKVAAFPIDDASNVQTAEIDFPAWAFLPTASANTEAWKANAPDLDWKLSHLGTKAVCVLHERESVTWDTAYLSDPNTNLVAVPVKASYVGATGTQDLFGLGVNPAVSDIYTFGRGILEIAIAITSSGGNFSLSVASSVIRAPRESDRGTFMADYAWHDVEDVDVVAGDMILLDIERWYQSTPYVANRNDPYDVLHIDTRETGEYIVATGPPPEFVTTTVQIPGSLNNMGMIDPSTITFVQPEGLVLAREIEWDTTFVTGQAKSFFSLRKRAVETLTGADDGAPILMESGDSIDLGAESEILAIEGESLLGCSLKTLALAVGIEYVERVDRAVPRAYTEVAPAGFPGEQTMPHVISHPGVAIYTQGRPRQVLTPSNASDAVVAGLNAIAATDPRGARASGWTYMAANDLGNWSGLSELRDFQIGSHYLCNSPLGYPLRLPILSAVVHPLQAVSVEDRNWWLAMCAYSSNKPLLFVTNPNFGWALYASEVMHRMQMANTTFFSHPNGTWAFYDDNRIYNTYGLPDIFQTFNAANRLDVPGKYGEFKSIGILYTFGGSGAQGVYKYDNIEYRYGEPAAYSQMRKFVYDGAGPVPTFLAPLTISDNVGYGVPDAYGQYANYHVVTLTVNCLTANIWNTYNTLTPAVNANGFSHCVFDHVHLEHEGSTLDTSLGSLYAEAVGAGTDDLRAPTAAETAAVCTAADVDSAFALTIEWPPGSTQTVSETAYRNQWNNWPNIDGHIALDYLGKAPFGAGKLLKYRLVRGDNLPPTFSTCLMLDL